ncbi:MAG: hypothetical protein ACLPJW_04660 [Rhodomicrobium sp.]
MSVSIHVWALPPASALFRRLEHDKAFVTLMAALFPYGRGVFVFFNETEAGERESILERVIEDRRSRLGHEPRHLIEEFREELERTRLTYPGVEHRGCSLEYTCFLIEKQLSEALKPAGSGAEKLVRNLIYGDLVLGKSGANDIESIMQDHGNTVGLVSPALVQEGAQILCAPGAEMLFASVWQLEDFQNWRRLYQAAAAEDEALLVGTC